MDGASYGNARLPIKKLYLLAALALLLEGTERLRAKHLVSTDMYENTITYLLNNEMRLAQREGTSDIINWDFRVHTQSDSNDPLSISEIDFKFRWSEIPNDYDRYLAAEAKRLFGKGDSLAGKYVEEGVHDFVIGKYGKEHNYGIMLGYILVGPLLKAVASVHDAMTTRKAMTAVYAAFTPNDTLCSHPHTHHSTHIQQGTAALITLIHVFLDFS